MLWEIHLENKKVINILAVSGIIVLFIAFLFEYKCIFRHTFDIPCVSCGLTRGFKYILKLDLINAIKVNFLSLPIFICFLLFYVFYILWIILKKEYIFKYYKYFVKHYKLFIVILVINWIFSIILEVKK